MEYLAYKLMSTDDALAFRRTVLSMDSWQDGKLSAGGEAKRVKKNLELKGSDKSMEIIKKLFNDNAFNSFALPKVIHHVMFSQTSAGMGYGLHFDNSYMGDYRCDLSFTLFLSNPSEYEGGELSLEIPPETRQIKLNAGEMIIYPTKYLHEVKKVTKGNRVVCVGWVQSKVASHEERNMCYLIDVETNKLYSEHGPSNSTKVLFQTYHNLLRKFSD